MARWRSSGDEERQGGFFGSPVQLMDKRKLTSNSQKHKKALWRSASEATYSLLGFQCKRNGSANT